MIEQNPNILSIVIPAYNEEDAIASIIERTLAAKDYIISNSSVTDVEIIVVSDGSTDQTATIAATYEPDIKLISYTNNKGYGAAIKTGFKAATGEIVSFLDADGTCDPNFFANMVNKMDAESADIVIGSRMGKQSKMPRIRRLGNTLFVNLIKLLSKQTLTDSASGMRIIKQNRLPDIYPLPDGLHFTPAMSVRAIFDSNLKIAEVDMTYEERTGESKLHVLKDGVRFLRVILEAALGYNPFRIFAFGALALIIFSASYAWYPLYFSTQNEALPEWMIYRLIAVFITFNGAVLLLIFGRVTQTLIDLANNNRPRKSPLRTITDWFFLQYGWLTGLVALIASVIILWPSITEYISLGTVSQHWSTIMVGSFALLFSLLSMTTGVLNIGLNYIKYRFEQ
jgi:glycosyltransferase involved in cell wall biosynthesis